MTNPLNEADKKKRGKASRLKGANFEREIAKDLREFFGPTDGDTSQIKRGIGQTRAAHEVPDVEFPPFWIEAKRHRISTPRKALAQAYRDLSIHKLATGDSRFKIPIAITKDDNDKSVVTLFLADFLALLYPNLEAKAKEIFGLPKLRKVEVPSDGILDLNPPVPRKRRRRNITGQ